MQGTMNFLIEYVFVNIIPKMIFGIIVIFIWYKVGSIDEDIKRGISEYKGKLSTTNERRNRAYNLYIQQPSRAKLIIRSSLFSSAVLFGLLLVWAGPFDAYLPILLLFTILGIISAYCWSFPSLDISEKGEKQISKHEKAEE